MAVELYGIRQDMLKSLRGALFPAGPEITRGLRKLVETEKQMILCAMRDDFSVEQIAAAIECQDVIVQRVLDEYNKQAPKGKKINPTGNAGARVNPIPITYREVVDCIKRFTHGESIRSLAGRYKNMQTRKPVTDVYVREMLKRQGVYDTSEERKAIQDRRRLVYELTVGGKTQEEIRQTLEKKKINISLSMVGADQAWIRRNWPDGPDKEE
ncbi:MAG: hypothetical protein ACIAQU_04295 [Phycisphaerales bacterium JB064]